MFGFILSSSESHTTTNSSSTSSHSTSKHSSSQTLPLSIKIFFDPVGIDIQVQLPFELVYGVRMFSLCQTLTNQAKRVDSSLKYVSLKSFYQNPHLFNKRLQFQNGRQLCNMNMTSYSRVGHENLFFFPNMIRL